MAKTRKGTLQHTISEMSESVVPRVTADQPVAPRGHRTLTVAGHQEDNKSTGSSLFHVKMIAKPERTPTNAYIVTNKDQIQKPPQINIKQ